MRTKALVFLAVALFTSAAAAACEFDGPYIPKLPNETEAEQESRMEAAFDRAAVLREYERQKSNFQEARSVFLGQIIESTTTEPQPGVDEVVATVKPLRAFKGGMPSQPQTLRSTNSSGLCYPMGDGYAPYARKGDFVIVFMGVKTYGKLRPNGIDSMDIRKPMAEELVEGLKAYGIDDLNG